MDVTCTEADADSRPEIASTLTVMRDCAATVRGSTIVDPPSSRNVNVTGASVRFGFAISTSLSKNSPVAPSAR